MKKWMSIIITYVFLLTMFPMKTVAEEEITKENRSTILIEQQTGEILLDKNAHESLPPASMTKLMTLLLVMEALHHETLSLNEKVRVSEYAASMGGTQIFLEQGEEMTVEELIKAIAIASANDASVALAEKIAGSEKLFVEQMNEKVKQLGLKNTHFVNTSGLPAKDHYSSAYDMAMIAKELLQYENITKYTSIYEDYLRKGKENEFWLVNTNKLVRFAPEVDGLKTGYTSEAMYCLTATAKKGDMRLIAVVMGAETAKERNAQIMELFDYGFATYGAEEIFAKDEVVRTYENYYSKDFRYDVVTPKPVYAVRKKADHLRDWDVDVVLHDKVLKLPIKEGTEVGIVQVRVEDEVVQEHPVVLKKKVERATIIEIAMRLWKSVILSD